MGLFIFLNIYSRSCHPGLDKTNFDQFWTNLLALSLQVPMFPHPEDLLASASKIQRDNDLLIAATQVTNTPFPRSLTITTGAELQQACNRPMVVIKREFSDSTSCTFLPSGTQRTEVYHKFMETQRLYGGITSLPIPGWIAQPYIDSLAQKGELRAFVVGGKVFHTVHTWPEDDQQSHEMVDNITPLGQLG
jgi:hypothetical protein